jgi:hypothetical protein
MGLVPRYRFGIHFAREIYTRILLLPADPCVLVKPKRKKANDSAGEPLLSKPEL